MNGLINNLNSPSVAPDEPSKTPTNAGSQRPQSPFVGQQAQPSSRITSSKLTRDDANILVVNDNNAPSKNERNDNKSQQEQNPLKFEKAFFFKLKISFLFLANHLVEKQVQPINNLSGLCNIQTA